MSLRISPRFSLRTLLIVMATAGVLLAMAARVHSRGQRQRQILAAASEVGGDARYDFECNKSRYYAAQRWLAPRIGADYVGQVQHLTYRAHGSPEWRQSIAAATVPSGSRAPSASPRASPTSSATSSTVDPA